MCPDNVLTPLIAWVCADNYFLPSRQPARMRPSAWQPALKWRLAWRGDDADLGLALIANALDSLVLPYRIPTVMVITLGIVHHTLRDEKTVAQALNTYAT